MPSDFERACLMARSVFSWGFSSETEEHFTRRIAEIGATHGVMAAAQAISDDCNASGLKMSPQRVLKSLAHAEQQLRRQ